MFIQFGYVVLFSSAFPLAALCALLNNVIEIRSDAFKLCTNLRRPFGERVENIGTWQVGGTRRENVCLLFLQETPDLTLLNLTPTLYFRLGGN